MTALESLLDVEPLSECCAASPHHLFEDRCGDCHDNAVFTRECPVCEAEVLPGDEAAHVTLACPTLYPLPRPAIAPVPLSGGRTLAWDGAFYVVIFGDRSACRYAAADELHCNQTLCAADARAILAFVAQVEGVAT